MTTTFQQNAIIQDGKRFPVFYSGMIGGKKLSIYGKGHTSLRNLKGINVNDNSDIRIDYYETPTIELKEGDKYFEEAQKALEAKENARTKRGLRR